MTFGVTFQFAIVGDPAKNGANSSTIIVSYLLFIPYISKCLVLLPLSYRHQVNIQTYIPWQIVLSIFIFFFSEPILLVQQSVHFKYNIFFTKSTIFLSKTNLFVSQRLNNVKEMVKK